MLKRPDQHAQYIAVLFSDPQFSSILLRMENSKLMSMHADLRSLAGFDPELVEMHDGNIHRIFMTRISKVCSVSLV